MKKCILLFTCLFFIGCSHYNINGLQYKILSFDDLPKEVANYIKTPDDSYADTSSMLVELPLNKEKKYRLENVKTWIGPWVSHKKLIDIQNKVTYKINKDIPSPYIVYENKLYIADRYNIKTTVADVREIKFIEFQLK